MISSLWHYPVPLPASAASSIIIAAAVWWACRLVYRSSEHAARVAGESLEQMLDDAYTEGWDECEQSISAVARQHLAELERTRELELELERVAGPDTWLHDQLARLDDWAHEQAAKGQRHYWRTVTAPPRARPLQAQQQLSLEIAH